MSTAERFSVSLSSELLAEFDKLLKQKNYSNRSEFIRDLIRDSLVQQEVESDEEIVGVVTLVYDHHVRELNNTLIDLQHNSECEVTSTMHIHLDHHNCLEVIIVRGYGKLVHAFADQLIGTRGVKHGKLVITSTGMHLPH